MTQQRIDAGEVFSAGFGGRLAGGGLVITSVDGIKVCMSKEEGSSVFRLLHL